MKFCRTFLPLLCAFFAFTPLTASAQAPEPRLRGAIREDTRAILPGSCSPRTLHAQDLGPAPANQPLHGITLVFRRSANQQADLDHLLAVQQDPASPQFHHWLTPEAFGLRFGMADADLEATQRWLTSHGFTIDGVSRARDRITFSGTAAQVAATFGATLHHYQIDGEPHLAPSSDLSLPADLAAVTTAILHLSDFRPHPNAHLKPRPAYTAGATQSHYLVPGDLAVMYDLPAQSISFYPGAGQSIAIVGQTYVEPSSNSIVRQFVNSVSPFGLNLTPVLVPNTGVEAISPGDAFESDIDIEYTSGIVGGANILFVHVGSSPNYNVFDALAFAVDSNVAPVISISYSQCETLLSQTDLAQQTSLFQQAASQGQTLVAATGDDGSTACAPYPVSPYLSATQQQALAVNYPADSPYVIAVGGTQMVSDTFSPGPSTYWFSTPSPGFDVVHTLLSYVPETTWNEGSATVGMQAGGGGASALVPRPTWQSGVPGIPTGTTRLLPDIALLASISDPGFLFCTDDPAITGGQQPPCDYGSFAQSSYPLAGGTSFAAPTFAAMVVLLNQNTQASGQGNFNPVLYRLAANPATAASIFHDITTGSIACVPGATGCSAAGESGFAATPGYDQATGLGSIDFLHLQAALPSGNPSLYPTIVLLSPSSTALNAGEPYVLNINVTPVSLLGNPTPPTGSVSIAVDGVVLQPNLPLVTGTAFDSQSTASYTITAPAATGSHVLAVTYPGDATHTSASTTTAFNVGNLIASGSVTLAAGNVTLQPNGAATSTVVVTPSGGYNGRLFWSLSLSGGNGSSLTGCYAIPSLPIEGVTTTTLSLALGTVCSSALPAARGALRPTAWHTAANPLHPGPWNALPIATGLLFCLWPAARRRRALPLLCLLLTAVGATLSGCGGGSSGAGSGSSNPVPATPAVTYTATLTGTDSVTATISSSTTFTLTVQ